MILSHPWFWLNSPKISDTYLTFLIVQSYDYIKSLVENLTDFYKEQMLSLSLSQVTLSKDELTVLCLFVRDSTV